MTKSNFTVLHKKETSLLKAQIAALEKELEEVERKVSAFEHQLQSHLIEELIEEQELSLLYKKQKLEKKAKRLEQKKKGKNFKEVVGVQHIKQKVDSQTEVGDKKERKRLYREAMLHVHPDKFSMDEGNQGLATEITSKLVDIYQSGSLQELQAYHAYIFNGQAELTLPESSVAVKTGITDSYLKKEKERLEQAIQKVKSKHTYKVLMGYENPLSFVIELKEYYSDRIFKLRKRTRTTN
ncbi:MAG: hypothetical protein AB8B61_00405 [Cyclobacteriaceae bacterium]